MSQLDASITALEDAARRADEVVLKNQEEVVKYTRDHIFSFASQALGTKDISAYYTHLMVYLSHLDRDDDNYHESDRIRRSRMLNEPGPPDLTLLSLGLVLKMDKELLTVEYTLYSGTNFVPSFWLMQINTGTGACCTKPKVDAVERLVQSQGSVKWFLRDAEKTKAILVKARELFKKEAMLRI